MEPERATSTVYYDGSCPLCRAEIGYYSRTDQDGALCFVDVSAAGAAPPEGLTQREAMARFHVRAGDGRRRLPRWRWAARLASLPGVLAVLELGYRLFLPVRPFISRGVARLQQRAAGSERG